MEDYYERMQKLGQVRQIFVGWQYILDEKSGYLGNKEANIFAIP